VLAFLTPLDGGSSYFSLPLVSSCMRTNCAQTALRTGALRREVTRLIVLMPFPVPPPNLPALAVRMARRLDLPCLPPHSLSPTRFDRIASTCLRSPCILDRTEEEVEGQEGVKMARRFFHVLLRGGVCSDL